MKKRLSFKILLLSLLALLFVGINGCDEPIMDEGSSENLVLKSANSDKESYIVVLNDTELNTNLSHLKTYREKRKAVKASADRIVGRSGVMDGEVSHLYSTAIHGFSVKIPKGQVEKLRKDPSVKYIEVDQIAKAIDFKVETNEMDAAASALSGDEIPWGIARVHGGIEYTGTNVAWIIDTGIDSGNGDLNVDASRGKSFVDGNISTEDDYGHGTHVSGILAARADGNGIVGVAAGATVIPIKVLDDSGSGYYSWIIEGVDFVEAHGNPGDVANMSLGGGYSKALNDAVISASNKGIKFSIAAGNEKTKASLKSPASAEGPNIYTVSAMDINENFASFSNYGNPPVDYCAPGVSIKSYTLNGVLESWSGTSMAAPHVGGILLLGDIATEGYVKRDKDRIPDPIAIVGDDGSVTNHAPVANAGPDQTLTDYDGNGESITLNGSASSDPDGNILSYSWKENSIVIATGVNPTINFNPGVHTITLTVSDGELSASDNVIITVNEPPTADFSFDVNYLKVNFSDKSTDDGSIIAWNWSFGDGSTSSSQNPTHTYGAPGTYPVKLMVTDNNGVTGLIMQDIVAIANPGGVIALSVVVTGSKTKTAKLTWTGATGASVVIKTNGTPYKTVSNTGSYTYSLGRKSGTITFTVCETNDSVCSNDKTVSY